MEIEGPSVGGAEEEGAEGVQEEEREGGEEAVQVEHPVEDGGAAEAVDGRCDGCAEVGACGWVGDWEGGGCEGRGGEGGCEVCPEEAEAGVGGVGVRLEFAAGGGGWGDGVVSPDPGLGRGCWHDC